MINFPFLTMQKFLSLTVIIFSGLLLQACGGQRDEPFDSGSSASSSSRGASVTIRQLKKGDDPLEEVPVEGAQVRILDEDTFNTYWDKYTNDISEEIDFSKGQVLLLDYGKKQSCNHKLTLRSFAAYQESVNSVAVVLNYRDVDASSKSSASSAVSSSSVSSSSCSGTLETQPYYFFYIETRNAVILEENAN